MASQFDITPDIVASISKISVLSQSEKMRVFPLAQCDQHFLENSLASLAMTEPNNSDKIRANEQTLIAYQQLKNCHPSRLTDLLTTHHILMSGLIDNPGQLRKEGSNIKRNNKIFHQAPPAWRLPLFLDDLLRWLANTDDHPLIVSSIFHYEFVFIQPFSDGNGRMARLWQNLLLSHWIPSLSYIPIENILQKRQTQYFQTLAQADETDNTTEFIEFMLSVILEAIRTFQNKPVIIEQQSSNQQVTRLLKVLSDGSEKSTNELMQVLSLKHRPTFRKNYLKPALTSKLIEMTQPDTPRSPTQRYRLARNTSNHC
jgi:Fic family protein